jgi:hypothetical protein
MTADDQIERDRRRLRFRNPELLLALVGYVYDADGPVPWNELLEVFTEDGRPWKTVENTLYDLVTFGAFHRIGKPAQRGKPDSRALKPTTLGRAWLDRELLPLPTDPVDDDFAELVPDDLELEILTHEPDPDDPVA